MNGLGDDGVFTPDLHVEEDQNEDIEPAQEVIAEATSPSKADAPPSTFVFSPPSLRRKQLVEIDLDKFNHEVISNYEDSRLAYTAKFDPGTHKLTVYLPPHAINFQLDYATLGMHVGAGKTDFKAANIGSWDTDETKLPTCKFYVPSKKQTNSEIPSNWKFATGFVNPSCTSPERGAKPMAPEKCDCWHDHTACPSYQELTDQPLLQVVDKNTKQPIATVSKHYHVPRVQKFVIDTKPDEMFDSREDVEEYLEENFHSDMTDFVNIETERNSYFAKVFS